MRRSRRLIALLSVMYLLFLCASAPASLLGRAFSLPPGVALDQLQGSLWHGSAGKLSIASRLGIIQVNDVHWAVQWSYLLRGELALQVDSAAAAGTLSVARGFGGWRLLHADLALPAADLAQILPALAIWQPVGEVQLLSDGFAPNAAAPGAVQVSWRNAGVNLSPLQPLGDYRLRLSGAGDKITARLETESGKLQLAGQGEYSPQRGLIFSGSAQAETKYAQELQALLVALGKDRGDGVHALSLRQPY